MCISGFLKVILIVHLLKIVLFAQFADLRAPGDGSMLYYSVSVPRPAPDGGYYGLTNPTPKSLYSLSRGPATLIYGSPEPSWLQRNYFGFGDITEYYQASGL